jgi:AcrR family transcriptional regulator
MRIRYRTLMMMAASEQVGVGASLRYGAAREQAVLSAVFELLGEVGYEALTIDAVAARAHASKTTIYRRWPGKAELVRGAVSEAIKDRGIVAVQATSSLRDDLLAAMGAICTYLSPDFIAMMRGLVHAMSEDKELVQILRPIFDNEAVSRVIIKRAVARGEVEPGASRRSARLVHEVIEGQVFRRLLLSGEDMDDHFCMHVIDDMLLPILIPATGNISKTNRQIKER